MRIIIVKKSTVKRYFAISLLMIVMGISLISPFKAQASTPQTILAPHTFIFYLYPMPENNGMFWLEQSPQLGHATLQEWSSLLPKGEMIVAVPENMQLASLGGLDRIGNMCRVKSKELGVTGNTTKMYSSIAEPSRQRVLLMKSKLRLGSTSEITTILIG